MLKQRVLTALALGTIFLLSIFLLPDWIFGWVVSAVVLLALREWCALVKIGSLGFLILAVVCVIPVVYCSLSPFDRDNDGLFLLAAGYLLSMSFWLLSAPTFLYFRMEPVGWYWRYAVAVLILVPAAIAMLELRRVSPLLMLGALLVVSVADIAAFFTGRAFGKRKLAPEISPGKTWEGVYGAVAAVLVFCMATWLFTPSLHEALSLPWVIGLSMLYVFVCVVGDLFESLLKRLAGVKDSGSLLPGHGGVLDRIDAMLAFFPFAGATLLVVQFLR